MTAILGHLVCHTYYVLDCLRTIYYLYFPVQMMSPLIIYYIFNLYKLPWNQCLLIILEGSHTLEKAYSFLMQLHLANAIQITPRKPCNLYFLKNGWMVKFVQHYVQIKIKILKMAQTTNINFEGCYMQSKHPNTVVSKHLPCSVSVCELLELFFPAVTAEDTMTTTRRNETNITTEIIILCLEPKHLSLILWSRVVHVVSSFTVDCWEAGTYPLSYVAGFTLGTISV